MYKPMHGIGGCTHINRNIAHRENLLTYRQRQNDKLHSDAVALVRSLTHWQAANYLAVSSAKHVHTNGGAHTQTRSPTSTAVRVYWNR